MQWNSAFLQTGSTMTEASRFDDAPSVDVVIVGAGFAGMYALYCLREQGFDALVLEAGPDVGGTWYWNRYPGARCDVDSVEYQLGFPEFLQREWVWSERYATQPEIERYLRFVADRLDLRRSIRFGEEVISASYEADAAQWRVRSAGGLEVRARFCIMALGCLSVAMRPVLEGLEHFAGEVYHTAAWPERAVEFRDKRVAVIGTGSSGIQVISSIAPEAARLFVLQRTPVYVFPAYNGPLDAEFVRAFRDRFREHRAQCRHTWGGTLAALNAQAFRDMSLAERNAALASRWKAGGGFAFLGSYADLLIDAEANEYAADFVRQKIREIVKDPELAERLTPRGFPLGTKRICLGTEYYETFLRDNVELVDLRSHPIRQVTESGLVCGDELIRVDMIVLATGFDAITGALSRINITAGSQTLKDAWKDGPHTYLGLSIAGFPNLFTVTGPGSPSVLSNVVVSIEQHVDWIVDCLRYLREHGYATIEATELAAGEWTAHVEAVAQATLYPRANSWYMGANVDGKKRTFLPYVGGVHTYRQKCDAVAHEGYTGFELKASTG
jgi:cyclohexanone monooxygenase